MKYMPRITGLVSSAQNSQIFWVVSLCNPNGNCNGNCNNAYLTAVRIDVNNPGASTNGTIITRFNVSGLDGVNCSDWQAVGYVSNARGRFIYTGKIGDDQQGAGCVDSMTGSRPYITLYEVPEPTINLASPPTHGTILVANRQLDYKFPETAINPNFTSSSAALFVNPIGSDAGNNWNDFYVVQNRDKTARIYKGNTQNSGTTLTSVACHGLDAANGSCGGLSDIVDGAISSDGNRVALRSPAGSWEWKKGTGETLDSMLGRRPDYAFPMATSDNQTAGQINRAGDGITYVWGDTTNYDIIETAQMNCNCTNTPVNCACGSGETCAPSGNDYGQWFCPDNPNYSSLLLCQGTSCAPISRIRCTR